MAAIDDVAEGLKRLRCTDKKAYQDRLIYYEQMVGCEIPRLVFGHSKKKGKKESTHHRQFFTFIYLYLS